MTMDLFEGRTKQRGKRMSLGAGLNDLLSLSLKFIGGLV